MKVEVVLDEFEEFVEKISQAVRKAQRQVAKYRSAIPDENQEELPLEPNPKMPSRNEKVLRLAQFELGTKEVAGPGNNARVMEYHRYASKNNKVEQPDDVPWCSSFVCFVAEKAGMGSTDSMMARSWLKWGISTKKSPLPGDIVVYWRGNKSGWKGHVGIYLRTNADGSIVTLGGNQSDEVNVTNYSSSKLLDIRRSSKARVYDNEDARILRRLADDIIQGKIVAGKIKSGGKVT